MFIAKILPAKGGNFNGVDYNEVKSGMNDAGLLVASNFKGLDDNATKQDYITFLQKHSNENSRVKLPQFHATISGKGNETSYEELQKFGEHYMEKMGYGSNPYLIYKHTDTENNHIHIVSSRVDYEGKKISDSLERVRTQKIRSEYLGLDNAKDIDQKINDISRYRMTTEAQYRLLLEAKFNKVINKESVVSVYQAEIKKDIPKELIRATIDKGSKYFKTADSKKRKEELSTFLTNLSKEFTLNEIVLLAKKEGLDITVFKDKSGTNNFGYSVIDHKTRAIYKGSEILNLNILENNKRLTEDKKSVSAMIDKIRVSGDTLESINNKISSLGYNIDRYGSVFSNKEIDAKSKFSLDPSTVYDFVYNSNVKDVQSRYKIRNEEDLKIISKAFKIRSSDLSIDTSKLSKDEKQMIYDFNSNLNIEIGFYAKNDKDLKEQILNSSINLYKIGDTFYALDTESNFIGSVELSKENKKIVEDNNLFVGLKNYETNTKENAHNINLEGALQTLGNLMDYQDEKDPKKKKKRTQTMNR